MKQFLALATVMLVLFAGLMLRITAPWILADDYASAAFAMCARNHVDFGLLATRGASILGIDHSNPAASPVYCHHPSGFPLSLALVFLVTGSTEWAARFYVALWSLAGLWLLYRVVAREHGFWTGLAAMCLAGLTPSFLFDGRLVSLEPPVVTMIVAAVAAYLRWNDSRRRRDLWLLLATMAGGMLIDWQAFYLAGILPLDHWRRARRGADRRAMLALALTGPIMFAGFLAHLAWADPTQLRVLLQAAMHRSGLMSAERQINFAGEISSYSPLEFVVRLAEHANKMLTWPFLLLSLGSLGWLTYRSWRRASSPSDPRSTQAAALPWLLLAPALCHTLLFSNTLYVHACLVILYLPGLASAGAIGLSALWAKRSLRDAGFVVGMVLILLQISCTVRQTAELNDAIYTDPWICGVETGRITGPDDQVLVLGLPYHPAVEWYCRRDLRFADRTDPAELFANAPPNVVVVAKGTVDYVATATDLDASGERFRQRTAAALEYLRGHYRPDASTDHFEIYRRP